MIQRRNKLEAIKIISASGSIIKKKDFKGSK